MIKIDLHSEFNTVLSASKIIFIACWLFGIFDILFQTGAILTYKLSVIEILQTVIFAMGFYSLYAIIISFFAGILILGAGFTEKKFNYYRILITLIICVLFFVPVYFILDVLIYFHDRPGLLLVITAVISVFAGMVFFFLITRQKGNIKSNFRKHYLVLIIACVIAILTIFIFVPGIFYTSFIKLYYCLLLYYCLFLW